MPVLHLTEDEVRELLTMETAIEAVEAGLRKMALEEAFNIPRSRCQTDHAMLHVLPAAAKTLGVIGYKAYVTSRTGTRFHVTIYDGKSGEMLALMQADHLGQMRTGAASAVATNVPGPPQPLYLAGGRIGRLIFWVPQSGDIGLGISILSYAGSVQFGLVADALLLLKEERVLLVVEQHRHKDGTGQSHVKQKLTIVDVTHVAGVEFNDISALKALGVGPPPAVRDTEYRPGMLVG